MEVCEDQYQLLLVYLVLNLVLLLYLTMDQQENGLNRPGRQTQMSCFLRRYLLVKLTASLHVGELQVYLTCVVHVTLTSRLNSTTAPLVKPAIT